MAWTKSRIVTLTKREGQSYGFYLRVEQGEEGHLIRSLEMGGPAELAGMKDGDRIIRVNGTFVDNMEHNQVADMVRKSGMTVTFHVIGEDAYKQAKADGVNLAEPQSQTGQNQPTMNGVSAPAPKAKLCYLQKSSRGFGFSLKSTKGDRGTFMTGVISGGVADQAGVKEGDRVVEINGEKCESATHDQIVQKVKATGTSVMLLLVDEDADKYFKNKSIRPAVANATVRHLPHKPRIADMVKRADGYGFMLKAEPNRAGHYIGEIDKGSPAERAGLKDSDRLVAVNGDEIHSCTHEEVVEKIHQQGNKCCLLVLDAVTEQMYKLGGASPLLYYEEMRANLPSYPESEPESTPALTPAPAVHVPVSAVPAPIPAETVHKPKLCRLEKTAAGYGFHLNGIQGVHGQYIKEVVKGGAADRAGVEDEDIVVEVNGVYVEMSTHEEVVNLIRKSGDRLVLLLAGKTAYDHLRAQGVTITPQLLDEEPSADIPKPASAQEEETNEQHQDNESDKETEKTATPPRSRTSSSSSSSSSDSEDQRL
ncbi:Na(+)/H(+) exchange regulatory cofactor NHE-RF3 [Triplophysa dalaica]|uniref:Na(+)/H(+) exchange regulatory cofactor NHE-RF3 n=1 Tax=Triplophysa dalaica TaxID=1582913 RepID=UPI0024DFC54F|nr:Na(+)/H(+) exchange regulatory cofactor NHE-RF3 [Triplophysa dalaica]XP_056611135.1 Na(+)/H(+) exchange regulatory cofactor NHE-RF3 [Triplophysa dalaica]